MHFGCYAYFVPTKEERPRQRRNCAAIGKEKSDAKQKPYMASVGHACRKMVSIIYAVMRDNKAYTPCIPNEISA